MIQSTPIDHDYTVVAKDELSYSSNSNGLVVEHSRHKELLVVKVARWRSRHIPWRYKKERQIHEILEHSQIVRFHHADDRFFTIYMEHIEGPNLGHDNFLDAKGMCIIPRDMISWILETLSQGLKYLRTQHVIHGDLKLAIVLFTPARGAIIADFGPSQRDYDLPEVGGSPRYMSYEHISGKHLGPCRDMFAAGIIMIYLLGLIEKPERPLFDANGGKIAAWRPEESPKVTRPVSTPLSPGFNRSTSLRSRLDTSGGMIQSAGSTNTHRKIPP